MIQTENPEVASNIGTAAQPETESPAAFVAPEAPTAVVASETPAATPAKSRSEVAAAAETPVAEDDSVVAQGPAPAKDVDAPWTLTQSEDCAPSANAETLIATTDATQMYTEGLVGNSRDVGYSENSWLSSIVVGVLVLLAINFNNCKRLFRAFPSEISGIRRRDNAFDEHTSNEASTYVLIIVLLCICEGILGFAALNKFGYRLPAIGVFQATMFLSGVALLLFLVQLATYFVVGYVFTDHISSRQWIRGYTASQGMLAAAVLLPAMVALFYPEQARLMVIIGIICYIFAKIAFILKGFRIFYDNFVSLIYFILYLCTLEITPIVFIAQMACGREPFFNVLS